jgi:large subunit ribosomal protein L32
MPVPKRKRSRSRRDKRFANKGIKPQSFYNCPNCQQNIMPHAACKECGYYKGAKVITTTKDERSLKRSESRQAQQARKQAKEQAMTALAENGSEQEPKNNE